MDQIEELAEGLQLDFHILAWGEHHLCKRELLPLLKEYDKHHTLGHPTDAFEEMADRMLHRIQEENGTRWATFPAADRADCVRLLVATLWERIMPALTRNRGMSFTARMREHRRLHFPGIDPKAGLVLAEATA